MMHDDATILLAIGTLIFTAAVYLGFFLGTRKTNLGLSIMGALWFGFTGIMSFGMYCADGWDVVVYALVLVGACVPIGIGGLVGAIIAWVKGGGVQQG
jgi:hypothetical protein